MPSALLGEGILLSALLAVFALIGASALQRLIALLEAPAARISDLPDCD